MEDKTLVTNEVKKPSSGFRKFFLWLFLCIALAIVTWIYWKFYFTYSEGYRTGVLQKLSYRGNVFKTYEGELVMNSIISKSNLSLGSEKFLFSIADDSIAIQLQNAEGKLIKLHYTQKNGTLFWRGDSEYIVDGFKMETP
jgi:hypothetical protein